MPKATIQTENAKICAAVLRLVAAKGWKNVTLEAVAKAAKASSASFKKSFATKNDLIPVIIEEIDCKVLATAGNPSNKPHDVLFDLLMARFDHLQANRGAILSIADASRRDPALSRTLACTLWASAQRLAAATKITAPPLPILAAGLGAVHGWAFLAWRRDESRDMAKTMAALDRALKLAGKAVGLFKPRS
jgi:AcrR family transcriptional regulator